MHQLLCRDRVTAVARPGKNRSQVAGPCCFRRPGIPHFLQLVHVHLDQNHDMASVHFCKSGKLARQPGTAVLLRVEGLGAWAALMPVVLVWAGPGQQLVCVCAGSLYMYSRGCPAVLFPPLPCPRQGVRRCNSLFFTPFWVIFRRRTARTHHPQRTHKLCCCFDL